MEAVQVGHEKIPADGIAGTHAELSAAQGVCFHDLRLSASDQVHGRFHMAQEDLPLRRELHLFRAADKERLIQLLLQDLDGLADCGLGDEELLGGFREA